MIKTLTIEEAKKLFFSVRSQVLAIKKKTTTAVLDAVLSSLYKFYRKLGTVKASSVNDVREKSAPLSSAYNNLVTSLQTDVQMMYNSLLELVNATAKLSNYQMAERKRIEGFVELTDARVDALVVLNSTDLTYVFDEYFQTDNGVNYDKSTTIEWNTLGGSIQLGVEHRRDLAEYLSGLNVTIESKLPLEDTPPHLDENKPSWGVFIDSDKEGDRLKEILARIRGHEETTGDRLKQKWEEGGGILKSKWDELLREALTTNGLDYNGFMVKVRQGYKEHLDGGGSLGWEEYRDQRIEQWLREHGFGEAITKKDELLDDMRGARDDALNKRRLGDVLSFYEWSEGKMWGLLKDGAGEDGIRPESSYSKYNMVDNPADNPDSFYEAEVCLTGMPSKLLQKYLEGIVAADWDRCNYLQVQGNTPGRRYNLYYGTKVRTDISGKNSIKATVEIDFGGSVNTGLIELRPVIFHGLKPRLIGLKVQKDDKSEAKTPQWFKPQYPDKNGVWKFIFDKTQFSKLYLAIQQDTTYKEKYTLAMYKADITYGVLEEGNHVEEKNIARYYFIDVSARDQSIIDEIVDEEVRKLVKVEAAYDQIEEILKNQIKGGVFKKDYLGVGDRVTMRINKRNGQVLYLETEAPAPADNGLVHITDESMINRKRWAVGIRDITVEENDHVEEGTFVSRNVFTNYPVDTVSVIADDIIPSDYAEDRYIRYYMSVDGETFSEINPLNKESYNFEGEDTVVPKVIYVNSTMPADRRQMIAGQEKAFIDTGEPCYNVWVRADMHRPSSDTYTQTTPEFTHYRLHILTETNN